MISNETAVLIGGLGGGALGGAIAVGSGWVERRHRARQDRIAATRQAGAELDAVVRTLCAMARMLGEQRAHPVGSFVKGKTRPDMTPLVPGLMSARSRFEAVAPQQLRPLGKQLVEEAIRFLTFAESEREITDERIVIETQPVIDLANQFRAAVRAATGPAELTRKKLDALDLPPEDEVPLLDSDADGTDPSERETD